MRVICAIALIGLAASVSSSEKPPVAFLERYCLDCHDADMAKANSIWNPCWMRRSPRMQGNGRPSSGGWQPGRCRRLSGSVSQAESSVVGCNLILRI